MVHQNSQRPIPTEQVMTPEIPPRLSHDTPQRSLKDNRRDQTVT